MILSELLLEFQRCHKPATINNWIYLTKFGISLCQIQIITQTKPQAGNRDEAAADEEKMARQRALYRVSSFHFGSPLFSCNG
jgi:hypothetical protein